MEVRFKEFAIPATTIQADSLNSQLSRSGLIGDRWLCGMTNNSFDPNFGAANAAIFTQIKPGKIYSTDRTNFSITKMTLNLVLDYYIYGDTINSESSFALHEITDPSFNLNKKYFTNSSVNYDPTPIATTAYQFNYDTLKKHRTLNADAVSTNNVIDSVTFNIPIESNFAKVFFDSATSKGIYIKRKAKDGITDTLVYNSFKTDSTFLKTFKGLAIIPSSGSRILGFTSMVGSTVASSSRITIYYSYETGGVTYNSYYTYFFQDGTYTIQDIPSFSKISIDRSASNVSGISLTNKYSDYNSPDGYCYVQSGSGLFSKLNFTEALDTFALYDRLTFNSAEIIIPVEPSTTRHHSKMPSSLLLKILKSDYRFFKPTLVPVISSGVAVLIPDPTYTSSYYSTYNYNDLSLDLSTDGSSSSKLTLVYNDDGTGNPYYSGYITSYLHAHSKLQTNVPRIENLALTPSTYFGKSLEGISFKKDKIKLRVYYSVAR